MTDLACACTAPCQTAAPPHTWSSAQTTPPFTKYQSLPESDAERQQPREPVCSQHRGLVPDQIQKDQRRMTPGTSTCSGDGSPPRSLKAATGPTTKESSPSSEGHGLTACTPWLRLRARWGDPQVRGLRNQAARFKGPQVRGPQETQCKVGGPGWEALQNRVQGRGAPSERPQVTGCKVGHGARWDGPPPALLLMRDWETALELETMHGLTGVWSPGEAVTLMPSLSA